jgi:hypothetical protein
MTLPQDGFASIKLGDGFSCGWTAKNGWVNKLDTFLAKARR